MIFCFGGISPKCGFATILMISVMIYVMIYVNSWKHNFILIVHLVVKLPYICLIVYTVFIVY